MSAQQGKAGWHPGLAKLSQEEVLDKYLTLYDNHEDLKKICRAQEEKNKRFATKILKLAGDRKRRNRSRSGTRDEAFDSEEDISYEWRLKCEKLEDENRDLTRKMETLKTRFKELQQSKKIRTSKVDSGIPFPSGRPMSGTSPQLARQTRSATTTNAIRTGMRRVESSPQLRSIQEHLQVATKENENMLEAISHLQRQLAQSEATNKNLNTQLSQKNEMLNFSSTHSATHQNSLKAEITNMRKTVHKSQTEIQTLQFNLDSKDSKVSLLERQLDAAVEAQKATLAELDIVRRDFTNEIERNKKLQSDKRALSLLREELQAEKDAKEDLDSERALLRDQLAAIRKADSVGSNIVKERENHYKSQIKLLEESIGHDAKAAQKLRLELHQEKLMTQRLVAKLDELEGAHRSMQETLLVHGKREAETPRESTSEAFERISTLKIATSSAGNTNQELEVALRQTTRRVRELEQKLITCHRQIQAKDEEITKLQKEYDATRKALEEMTAKQARTIDNQNSQITQLSRSLKQIGLEGTAPPVSGKGLTSSKLIDTDFGQAVPLGENEISLSLEECELFTQSSYQIFACVNFGRYKPVATNVVTGLTPNLKFRHCYQVDVSDDFLQFLQDGAIFIELNRVLGGTQYELIGRGKIPLRKFLNSQHFNGFVKIQSNNSVVSEIAMIQFSIAAKIPFENAATLHLEKSTARGFLQEENENQRFNSLSVNIVAGRQLDGIFDNEEPSCFCVYKFFTYDEMHTNVIESSSNPRFNFTARHSVEENENLHRYLSTGKLTILVVDKSDDGDDQEEFLGKCEIILASLIQRDEVSEVCTLVDPHGDESGQLEVRLAWEHPYKENHGAIKEPNIIPAEVEYENPILSESQKSSPRHGRSQSSASLISASLKSRTPSREVTPAADSDKEKTPTPAPRLSTQSSSDPYPFQAKNIDDDEESQTPSLHDVQKIKSPSPPVEDAPSLEATPTPESEDAQAPKDANKELRIRLKELRRSEDADETLLQSKVFIEFSLCGKLCETNPSMEYPKSFDSPTKIDHDEIIAINEGSEEENQLKLMMNGEFDSRVTFTLLTDPGEDDDGSVDCDDVATAEINLRDFKESPDLRDHLLDFVSTSSEAKILGQLLIDVSAAEAIRALHIQ